MMMMMMMMMLMLMMMMLMMMMMMMVLREGMRHACCQEGEVDEAVSHQIDTYKSVGCGIQAVLE
jgi:hypothetical protein